MHTSYAACQTSERHLGNSQVAFSSVQPMARFWESGVQLLSSLPDFQASFGEMLLERVPSERA